MSCISGLFDVSGVRVSDTLEAKPESWECIQKPMIVEHQESSAHLFGVPMSIKREQANKSKINEIYKSYFGKTNWSESILDNDSDGFEFVVIIRVTEQNKVPSNLPKFWGSKGIYDPEEFMELFEQVYIVNGVPLTHYLLLLIIWNKMMPNGLNNG